nr:MAG TPA: hypothetical protein [Caudoviricetes sp.]
MYAGAYTSVIGRETGSHRRPKRKTEMFTITDTYAETSINTTADAEELQAWFEESLPGDEIKDLREALIEAAVRMTGEDRELLASNGYEITED